MKTSESNPRNSKRREGESFRLPKFVYGSLYISIFEPTESVWFPINLSVKIPFYELSRLCLDLLKKERQRQVGVFILGIKYGPSLYVV